MVIWVVFKPCWARDSGKNIGSMSEHLKRISELTAMLGLALRGLEESDKLSSPADSGAGSLQTNSRQQALAGIGRTLETISLVCAQGLEEWQSEFYSAEESFSSEVNSPQEVQTSRPLEAKDEHSTSRHTQSVEVDSGGVAFSSSSRSGDERALRSDFDVSISMDSQGNRPELKEPNSAARTADQSQGSLSQRIKTLSRSGESPSRKESRASLVSDRSQLKDPAQFGVLKARNSNRYYNSDGPSRADAGILDEIETIEAGLQTESNREKSSLVAKSGRFNLGQS